METTAYHLVPPEILKLKAQVTNGSVIRLTSVVVNGLSIRNKNRMIYTVGIYRKLGYGFVLLCCCWFAEASVPAFLNGQASDY